jgi:hypothetical protein
MQIVKSRSATLANALLKQRLARQAGVEGMFIVLGRGSHTVDPRATFFKTREQGFTNDNFLGKFFQSALDKVECWGTRDRQTAFAAYLCRPVDAQKFPDGPLCYGPALLAVRGKIAHLSATAGAHGAPSAAPIVNDLTPIPEPNSGADQSCARWFAEEVQPHESVLKSWLRSRFPWLREVDDIAQEAAVRLWRRHNNPIAAPIKSAKAALFIIARNAAIDDAAPSGGEYARCHGNRELVRLG